MWTLDQTREFEREYGKVPQEVKAKFDQQFKKLTENPYSLGRPLGYKWFRELKNNPYRVYFLVYDQLVFVLFVAVSNKKSQQAAIDVIKSNLKFFKEFVEKRAKEL